MTLTLADLIVAPLYIILIYLFSIVLVNSGLVSADIKKYFIPSLMVKIFGAIMAGIIYQYYYKNSGDTINFYRYGAKIIFNAFLDSPIEGLKLLLHDTSNVQYNTSIYLNQMYFIYDSASYFVCRVGGIFSLFSFGLYSVISIFFALMSFSGVWAIFIVLSKLYPEIKGKLAFAVLFMPSVIFWGSGIFKDSITLSAVGWLFYCFFRFFIEKRRRWQYLLMMIIALYVLKEIKIYIAISFIPAIIIWYYLLYNKRTKKTITKRFIMPFVYIFGIVIGIAGSFYISKDNDRYNFDTIGQTSKTTADYIYSQGMLVGGATYNLGDFEPTVLGMLSKSPQAVWVTLFRPYFWESKNIIMFISALESFLFFFFTFKLFLIAPFTKILNIIKKDEFVLFALIFSIVFSFAVGISTYNFGTLVRYKIPMMPFYLSAIFVIEYKIRKSKENFRFRKPEY